MKRLTKLAAIVAATAAVALSGGVANAQSYNTPGGSVSQTSVIAGGTLTLAANNFKPESLVQVSIESVSAATSTTAPSVSGSLVAGLAAAPQALVEQSVTPPAGGCNPTGNATGIVANCQAGASGGVASTITTSASLAPGSYALRFTGVDVNDVARVTGQTITITAADGSTGTVTGGTPTVTGAAIATIGGIALVAAAAGGVIFFFGRSRRGATNNS